MGEVFASLPLNFFFYEKPAHRLFIGQDIDFYSSFHPWSINRFQQMGQPFTMLGSLGVQLLAFCLVE